MRNLVKLLSVVAIAFVMSVTAGDAFAQTSKRSTTSGRTQTSTESQTSKRSSAQNANEAKRSSSSSAATSRSSASQNTSKGSSVGQSASSRSSDQNNKTATVTSQRSGTSSNRSSAGQSTSSRSSAGATDRSSAGTVSRSSDQNNKTATSRSSANRNTSASDNGVTVNSSRPQSDSKSLRASESAVTQANMSSRTSASRSGSNVTVSKGLSNYDNGGSRSGSNVIGYNQHIKVTNHDVVRITPRERPHIQHNVPAHFYEGGHSHYFGYCVQTLPPRPVRHVYYGVTYYSYNNIYYRKWGSNYYVCRPPFGVCISYTPSMAQLRAIRFSYYPSVYRSYKILDRNYSIIDKQNKIIAKNNAIIASQSANMALNSSRALSSYEIAYNLGLVQSYANAYLDYFYEDGVFFTVNRRNEYEVIIPPAGALVDELPDDYDIIVMGGQEYYKVDDTVYRLVLVDGTPLLEVLGQLTGSLATRYNLYK